MIRAVVTRSNGRRVLVLGIDDVNVKRLTEGQPIHVDGLLEGLNFEVIILYGSTLQDIVEDLRKTGLEVPDAPKNVERGRPFVVKREKGS